MNLEKPFKPSKSEVVAASEYEKVQQREARKTREEVMEYALLAGNTIEEMKGTKLINYDWHSNSSWTMVLPNDKKDELRSAWGNGGRAEIFINGNRVTDDKLRSALRDKYIPVADFLSRDFHEREERKGKSGSTSFYEAADIKIRAHQDLKREREREEAKIKELESQEANKRAREILGMSA